MEEVCVGIHDYKIRQDMRSCVCVCMYSGINGVGSEVKGLHPYGSKGYTTWL